MTMIKRKAKSQIPLSSGMQLLKVGSSTVARVLLSHSLLVRSVGTWRLRVESEG